MKHFSYICCAGALVALFAGVSTAQAAEQDTLAVKVEGKTLYCTYEECKQANDYKLTLLNFDSIGQYDEFSSAIAQEIYMNYSQLFNDKELVRLIIAYGTPVEEPKDTNLVFRFEGCTFDFDRAVIKPEFNGMLDQAAEDIKALGQVVTVCGYTDSKGSQNYNKELSLRRAKAVRAYLIRKGCDPAKVKVKGYGAANPISTNDTDEGRAKNRRCEIRLNED